MNTNIQQLHDAKINALAEQYTLEGFSVTMEPSVTSLPFDLGGYRPDLIATKDNAGLIVEVKSKLERLSVERFRALAEEVGRHPGWRFLLVTLDDVETQNPPGIVDELPDWLQLKERINQAIGMLKEGTTEPALLYFWSIFEASLRKRATNMSMPIERFPVLRLINHMYSSGELTLSQYDLAVQILETRNKLAHGFLAKLDHTLVARFKTMVEGLLTEWEEADQKI